MKTTMRFTLFGLIAVTLFACSNQEVKKELAQSTANDTIIATYYDSNFPLAMGNYNGISAASDGKIYYVLCCHSIDTGGQMFVFDPATKEIEHLSGLTEACGENDIKAIPQGKTHVNFYEYNNKLYFATHIDHYDTVQGKELLAAAPEGYQQYQGGHILSYDLTTKEFGDIFTAPENEGIITMTMDTARGRIFCTTWPSGITFRYNVPKNEYKLLGRFFEDAEATTNNVRYQVINRSITVDPHTGNAFLCNVEGDIFKYSSETDEVEKVIEDNLVKSEFGHFEVDSGRTCGYMWRQSIWSDYDKKVYGYSYTNEILYSLDPKTNKIEIAESIASEIRKKDDKMGYGGSLAMVMGNDGHTIYYVSHARPENYDPSKSNKARTGHHLISYDLIEKQYADLGLIVFDTGKEPRHINSLTIGEDGTFYAMSYIEYPDSAEVMRSDLISFPNPAL